MESRNCIWDDARPISQTSFHAARVWVKLSRTMEGIQIDTESRTLKPESSHFVVLYAAGDTTGGSKVAHSIIYIDRVQQALIFDLRAAELIVREKS